jgi:tRNA threonylcarbamoyladenosine biosynthesis protein TsaB
VSQRVLAVDTTHEFGSLALLDGGNVVEEVLLHAPEGFGQVLYGHLAGLLERHGRGIPDVDVFAAASGPGSFTGVRVGLAAVKGLAEATGKPVVGVGNLEAIASLGTAPLRAVVLDARRGEIYGAVFDAAGRAVVPPSVGSFPAWLAGLPEGEIEFLSTDCTPFLTALRATNFSGARVTSVPRALAAAVGRIALARLREGGAWDAAAIDANYVRRSDAELFWKDQ